jgi:hypothetical protein
MLSRSLALAVFTAVSTFAASLPGVDPVLLNLVMPDATVLTGIQVDQSLASPFGQYVLSKMQPGDAGFVQFITATGFDPTKDLTQVLAATGATPVNQNNVLILGRGTFVPSQIASAAIAAGGAVTSYKGLSVITAPNDSSNTAVVFFNSTTAAIGSVAMVDAAIDRWSAQSWYTGNLIVPAQAASTASSAWFVTQTPLSDFLEGKLSGNLGNASQSNLFQSITAASGGINFGASSITVTGNAVTTSPQNAQALVNVLQFLVSMVQSNGNNPGAATLANAATFTTNGSTAQMTLTLPEQTAEQLFMQNDRPEAHHLHKPVQ